MRFRGAVVDAEGADVGIDPADHRLLGDAGPRRLAGPPGDPLSAGLGDAAPALLELGLEVASGHGLAGLAG